MRDRGSTSESGSSLVEVLVALGLAGSVALAITAAVLAAAGAAIRARDHGMATALAHSRLEQLRSLEWGVGDAAAPAPGTDLETDLSGPEPAAGGPGLAPSPPDALTSSQARYADYADRFGNWIAAGSVPPAGPAFVRRWRVSALPGAAGVVVFEVVVLPLRGRSSLALGPADVRFVTMKGRRAY